MLSLFKKFENKCKNKHKVQIKLSKIQTCTTNLASYSLMQWQFWQLTLKWFSGAHADAIYDVNNWMKLIQNDWVFELCDHPFNSIALRCNRFSLQTSIESSNDYMTAMKIFFGDHWICSGFRSISHAFYKIAVLEIIRMRNYCWNCTNCNNNWCKHTHSEIEKPISMPAAPAWWSRSCRWIQVFHPVFPVSCCRIWRSTELLYLQPRRLGYQFTSR